MIQAYIAHPEEFEVCEFDGVDASAVYVGGITFLNKINDKLTWRENEEDGELAYKPYKVLTMSEIVSQVSNLYGGEAPIITVICDSPIAGHIYQYGNYGDAWYEIGTTCGYA